MGKHEIKKRQSSSEIDYSREINTNTSKVNMTGQKMGSEIKDAAIQMKDRSAIRLADEYQDYYDRMLENSVNKDLVDKIRKAEFLEEGWNRVSWLKSEVAEKKFEQKLPTPKTDNKGRNIEKSAVKEAQRSFHPADICTVREMAAMKEYFKGWSREQFMTDGPETTGNDAPEDPALTAYLDSIISFDFGSHSLTDDYLSEHIAEVYEFCRKLNQYESLKEKYPSFFEHIPEEKRVIAETRAHMGVELKQVLEDHLKIHGIVINNKKAEAGADDRVVFFQEDNRKSVRRANRTAYREAYKTRLEDFHRKHIQGAELELARTYVRKNGRTEEGGIGYIRERIAKNEMAGNACGAELDDAVAELNMCDTIQQQLVAKQKEFLEEYDQLSAGDKRRVQIKRYIARTNRRIMLAAQNGDRYREFISYVLGDLPKVSVKTVKFLKNENKESMLDLIRFRTMGDYIEDAIVTKDRILLHQKIASYKEKAKLPADEKDSRKIREAANNAEAARELEEMLRTGLKPAKMPMERFYEKYTEYRNTAINQSEKMRNGLESFQRAQRQAKESVKEYAEKNHLVSCNDRISLEVKNAMGNIKDYDWIVLACAFTATDKTPPEVREEIREKGLRPLLNKMLSLEVKDFRDMAEKSKFDPEKKEGWNNLTILNVGMDMSDFLQRLRNNDIEISDEELIKLNAVGKLAEAVNAKYTVHISDELNPMGCLLENDERLKGMGSIMNDIVNGQFSGGAEGREAERFNERYSENDLGFTYTLDDTLDDGSPEADIRMFAGYFFSKRAADETVSIKEDEYEDVYNAELTRARESLDTREIRERRKVDELSKKYKEAYDPRTRAFMVDYRLHLWEEQKRMSVTDRSDFQKLRESGKNVFTAEDLTYILQPIERDSNDSIKAKDLKTHYRNRLDVTDYVSGDKKRQEEMLVRTGHDMTTYEFSTDTLKKEEFFDIKDGGFIRIYTKIKKGIGYRNLYSQHRDFFESDAFTEDERKAIRKNIVDNTSLTYFHDITEDLLKANCMNPDGSDYYANRKAININADYNKVISDEREYQARRTDEYFDTGVKICAENEKKRDEAYAEWPKLLKEMAELEVRIRAKLETATDPEETERLEYQRNRIIKCRKHVLNYEEEKQSGTVSDEDILFAVRNGFGIFYPKEDREKALHRMEKQEVDDKFRNYDDAEERKERGKTKEGGREIVECRIGIKNAYRKYDDVFTDEQRALWEEKMGKDSFMSFGSFKKLMRPVLRDDSGLPLRGYEKADRMNQRTLEQFISGDPKQIQIALYDIGSRFMNIGFEFDKYDADYILSHSEDFYSKALPFLAFKEVYDQYPDFFEGNAFSDEQKDSLRIMMSDRTYIGAMKKLVKYENGRGLDGGKAMTSPAEHVYDDEHDPWLKDILKKSKELTAEAEKEMGTALSTVNQMKEDLTVREDLVRKLAILHAGEKSALRQYRNKAAGNEDWSAQSKDFRINQRELRIKLFEEARAFQGRISAASRDVLKGIASNAASGGVNIEKNELEEALGNGTKLGKFIVKICQANPDAWFNAELDKMPKPEDIFVDSPDNDQSDEEYYREKRPVEALKKEKDIIIEEPEEEKKEVEKKADGKVITNVFIEDEPSVVTEKKEEIKEKPVITEKKEEKKDQNKKPYQTAVRKGYACDALAPGTEYEPQGYHNCWACAGAAIFNKFVFLQDGKLTDPVKQENIRDHVPDEKEFKTLDEVNAISGVMLDKDGYEAAKNELLAYMGKGKLLFGSIYEDADFFMKKRKDFVLSNMSFTLSGGMSKEEIDRYNRQKAVFVSKLKEILSTGNLPALLNGNRNHYVTVIEVRNDKITYLDSDKSGEEIRQEKNVEEVFERQDKGNSISITWFSPLKSPQDMVKDYKGLSYDEKTGFSYGIKEDLAAGGMNLAQTQGICITKGGRALGKDMEDITLSTYIPKRIPVMVQPKQTGQKIPVQEKPLETEAQKEKEKPVEIIIEKESQQKESQQKKGQPAGEAVSTMIDRIEKRGAFNILDQVFDKNDEYLKEYETFINGIMTRTDLSIDDDWIDQLSKSLEANIRKSPSAKKDRELFENVLKPRIKKISALVKSGTIGKDTAMLFLNPDAMTCEMAPQKHVNYDRKIYNAFVGRTHEPKMVDENEYKDEVAGLAVDYIKEKEAVSLSNPGGSMRDIENVRGYIGKHTGFVQFHHNKQKTKDKQADSRLYVTVKEDKQKDMVARLRQFLNENKKFNGAFNFKVMATQKTRKLDNLLIYYDSQKDEKLIREFIDGFSEKIKDIVSDEDFIPTISKEAPGIGTCPEPEETLKYLYGINKLNSLFAEDVHSMKNNTVLKDRYKREGFSTSKTRANISWDVYCSRLLILSAYVAKKRLNIKDMDKPVSEDEAFKAELEKVYSEFLILSDIDPATMKIKRD